MDPLLHRPSYIPWLHCLISISHSHAFCCVRSYTQQYARKFLWRKLIAICTVSYIWLLKCIFSETCQFWVQGNVNLGCTWTVFNYRYFVFADCENATIFKSVVVGISINTKFSQLYQRTYNVNGPFSLRKVWFQQMCFLFGRALGKLNLMLICERLYVLSFAEKLLYIHVYY